MTFSTTPGFRRLLKSLDPWDRKHIEDKIEEFKEAFIAGQIREGFGMKQLRRNIWELRVGLPQRVIFSKVGSCVVFLFIGNHNDIQRFLKHF